MRAAVVTAFDSPPRCQEIDAPQARGQHQLVVDVLAVGLHPRVRSHAAGTHYTSTDELPLVPGIDGVGRRPDGPLVYFVLPDTRHGAMAEQVVIDTRRSIELPADADPVVVAAAMNPAMSSWIALRQRTGFQPGQSVLILGATGNAGRMAVQVATRLGAAHVSAAGRNPDQLAGLPALGADSVVDLGADPDTVTLQLAEAGREVDVVLDYVWGDLTATALRAIVPARVHDDQQLTWVEIGSVANPESLVPAAALRATRLQIVGSGQGSVSPRAILTELPALVSEILAGTFAVAARPVKLADVETAWTQPTTSTDRLVVVP